jgi:hypothetical protein
MRIFNSESFDSFGISCDLIENLHIALTLIKEHKDNSSFFSLSLVLVLSLSLSLFFFLLSLLTLFIIEKRLDLNSFSFQIEKNKKRIRTKHIMDWIHSSGYSSPRRRCCTNWDHQSECWKKSVITEDTDNRSPNNEMRYFCSFHECVWNY